MPVYTAEMMLPPVRWVVRHEQAYPGSDITKAVHVLQQQWMIDEYGNPEKLGRPISTRREWRDVPVVKEE